MKQFLKQHLPPEMIRLGKKGWLSLRLIAEWLRIVKASFVYKLRNQSPSVLLWLSNPGSIGGTELQIRIIAEHLKDCLVMISGMIEEGDSNLFLSSLKAAKIPFLSLGKRGLIQGLPSPFARKVVSYFLRGVAPQGSICHFFNPASTAFVPAAKDAGFQIFYMETGMPTRGQGWHILDKMAAEFDYVTSVSQAGLDSLKRLFNYQGPSSVIPSMIYPFPRPQNAVKTTFEVIYFGRLTPLKGVDLLIRSFASLLERYPEAKLSVVGSGESLGELQALTKALGSSVQFTGWLKRDELFTHLSNADLVCLPSETEGMPGSILEAMSMGLPILATAVGGVPEIIEHGISGILIPPRDEQALKAALFQLAADPSLRARLGAAAFVSWQKREDQGAVMASLMAMYGRQ